MFHTICFSVTFLKQPVLNDYYQKCWAHNYNVHDVIRGQGTFLALCSSLKITVQAALCK